MLKTPTGPGENWRTKSIQTWTWSPRYDQILVLSWSWLWKCRLGFHSLRFPLNLWQQHPNTQNLLMGNSESIYRSLGSAAACVGKKACGKPVQVWYAASSDGSWACIHSGSLTSAKSKEYTTFHVATAHHPWPSAEGCGVPPFSKSGHTSNWMLHTQSCVVDNSASRVWMQRLDQFSRILSVTSCSCSYRDALTDHQRKSKQEENDVRKLVCRGDTKTNISL